MMSLATSISSRAISSLPLDVESVSVEPPTSKRPSSPLKGAPPADLSSGVSSASLVDASVGLSVEDGLSVVLEDLSPDEAGLSAASLEPESLVSELLEDP